MGSDDGVSYKVCVAEDVVCIDNWLWYVILAVVGHDLLYYFAHVGPVHELTVDI